MEEGDMSAVMALTVARAAGVELALAGDDLSLKAAAEPPVIVLEALVRHKSEIVALLRTGPDGWSAEDWRLLFDERAAVAATRRRRGPSLRMLRRRMAESESDVICGGSMLVVRPT
jgi:hypothetical protein